MEATHEVPPELRRGHGGSEKFFFDDPLKVADAICKKRHSYSKGVPEGVRGELVTIATGEKDFGEGAEPLGLDVEANFGILQNARASKKAVVASGGTCAPFTPMYDFYRLAEPQSPIEDAIPSVPAPRGGVNYIASPDYTQALAAVGINTLPKPVATVTCPTIVPQAVEPVTQIVQFDNLNYRVFPEQVAAFMEDTAVIFALTKEVVYLTAIDSSSTAVSSAIPYGAVGGLFYDWTTAAVAFRKRHGMVRGSDVEIMVPDWSLDMVKLDMVENHFQGLDFMNVPDAAVEDAMRSRGLVPVWYNDTISGGSQKFNAAQATGGLNPWPINVVSYIHGLGTYVRLDGGTLDVGLVRDSTLNKTNDLQLFMEEWISIIKLAPEAIKLTSTVCPNGSRGGSSAPFTCPVI